MRKLAKFAFHNLNDYSILMMIVNRLPGRHGGLMVSVLGSRSSGLGSSPGWDIALCSWTRHFTLIVPLSTQVYKWVPANLLLGVTLRWASIPFMGQ